MFASQSKIEYMIDFFWQSSTNFAAASDSALIYKNNIDARGTTLAPREPDAILTSSELDNSDESFDEL